MTPAVWQRRGLLGKESYFDFTIVLWQMSLCVQGTREGSCLPGKVATCWMCDLHFNMQLQHCTVWACKCYKWAVSDSPCSKQAWICFAFDITKLCAFCPFCINFLITYRWVPPSASCPMASHCLSGVSSELCWAVGLGTVGHSVLCCDGMEADPLSIAVNTDG